jgi:hypothetical protein
VSPIAVKPTQPAAASALTRWSAKEAEHEAQEPLLVRREDRKEVTRELERERVEDDECPFDVPD